MNEDEMLIEEELEQCSPEEQLPGEETTPGGRLPYHQRYYLRYHSDARGAQIDLTGTRKFLQDIGFDGGELRQARHGKDSAGAISGVASNGSQRYCSYCHRAISGVEFARLPDGRSRCSVCSNSLVTSQEEVEQICKRVLNHLDGFFGATISVPVAIEVLEHRKLKKSMGGPIDSRSICLGVAINRNGKYYINLENGAPRISLIATFAHEMTHIWQYTHWDNQKNFPKYTGKKRLLIYEGMAMWTEIQYLYLIGETEVAKRLERETRDRADEYGEGFVLYEAKFPLCRDAMSCDETPFTAVGYPIG